MCCIWRLFTVHNLALAGWCFELQALPNAAVYRVVCGGCGDFKVVVKQPTKDHGEWGSKAYVVSILFSLQSLQHPWGGESIFSCFLFVLRRFAPEEEFVAALQEIEGLSVIESQEYTMEPLFAADNSVSDSASVVTLGEFCAPAGVSAND